MAEICAESNQAWWLGKLGIFINLRHVFLSAHHCFWSV